VKGWKVCNVLRALGGFLGTDDVLERRDRDHLTV
jgi:hypothetical protein